MTTRKLRRPLPLDAARFREIAKGLTLAERGAAISLAVSWWPEGVIPEGDAALGQAMGCDPRTARRIAGRILPLFERCGALSILRAAHLQKAERRAAAGRVGLARRWGHSQGA